MRVRERRAPPELKHWQKAGWSREPRNGHELKLLLAGKPEPGQRKPKKRKCRRCKGSNFKLVHQIDGRRGTEYETGYCVNCRLAGNKQYRKDHPDEARAWAKNYCDKIRDMQPDFDSDGIATVSAVWLIRHQMDVVEAVRAGKSFIVEYLGQPAYTIGAI